jgi:hypothetical protein
LRVTNSDKPSLVLRFPHAACREFAVNLFGFSLHDLLYLFMLTVLGVGWLLMAFFLLWISKNKLSRFYKLSIGAVSFVLVYLIRLAWKKR